MVYERDIIHAVRRAQFVKHEEKSMTKKPFPRKGGDTSKPVASQAGKDLPNPKTPKQDRPPIASALRQYVPKDKKR